jgi:hypothetical protein
MSLSKVYKDAGLTAAEIKEIPRYLTYSRADFYDSPSHDKLFEYFAFKTREMPYGTAKARTGDPEIWIMERLKQLGAGWAE